MSLKKPKKGGMKKLSSRLEKLEKAPIDKKTLVSLEKAGVLKKKKKKKELDFMLDVETLAIPENPVVLQISGVIFDLTTGKTFEEFNEFISPKSCLEKGMKIDLPTVEWWLKQDKSVQKKVFVKALLEGKDVEEVLNQLALFLENVKKKRKVDTINIWGNGMLSDNMWMTSIYKKLGMKVPWAFWEDQDVRTLVSLGRRKYGIDPKKDIPFKGDKHNALDDCKHQIKYCVKIFKHKK